MSGDKRWTVGSGGDLWWATGYMDPQSWCLELSDMGEAGFGDKAEAAFTALGECVNDAARLRSLAATFDNRLNREQTFTGAQVAAMLRDGGE